MIDLDAMCHTDTKSFTICNDYWASSGVSTAVFFSLSTAFLSSPLYTVLRSTEYSRKNNVKMRATPAAAVVTAHIIAIERAHACSTAARSTASWLGSVPTTTTTTTDGHVMTHRNQVDLADTIVERCDIVTKFEAGDVWDRCEFPWKYDGNNSLTDGNSYGTTQRAEKYKYRSFMTSCKGKGDIAYRRNIKPLVAVAISFRGIAA